MERLRVVERTLIEMASLPFFSLDGWQTKEVHRKPVLVHGFHQKMMIIDKHT